MLTKDLLRVSRRGGGYRPEFAGPERRELAARLLGIYQGHVGKPKADLDEAIEAVERDHENFKLVRGFSKLLEREATFETRAPVDPERARRAGFRAAERVGVVTESERHEALERAAERLSASAEDVAQSLYADLPERQVLVAFEPRWNPDELVTQCNLSLAQTTLFDATELRARCSDPRRLISAVKRLGLMYEIRNADSESGSDSGSDVGNTGERDHEREPGVVGEREVVVTGPDALFRRTRRYGTRFARLLRTLAGTGAWRMTATIDDRGTERTLELTDADPVRVPGTDPVVDVTFDSGVEADFAGRFEALDLDWRLVREPDVLAAGSGAMVPDFAFDYEYDDFRVFFEIMGFWTPGYVEKKLEQLAAVENIELLVAADEDLGVGEDVTARDHRVITYSETVRVKDVRSALREYERDLVARAAADLPAALTPDDDVIPIEALSERHGVSEDALADRSFPEHERVGRTLVRPSVLSDLAAEVEPGMDLETAERRIAAAGISDASATLSALGYRVEWDGLTGGTIRQR